VAPPRISTNQIRITTLCTGAAIAYGIAHDQVTARLCPEYFLVAHPPLCSGHPISVVALCWGLAATWWVGLTIGVLLARVAGDSVTAGALAPRICALLASMAMVAVILGAIGWWLGGSFKPPGALADLLPVAIHRRFFAAWFAHVGSYAAGLAGGAALIRRTWRISGRASGLPILPRGGVAWTRAFLLLAALGFVAWRMLK
jgi:hypothetical protein